MASLSSLWSNTHNSKGTHIEPVDCEGASCTASAGEDHVVWRIALVHLASGDSYSTEDNRDRPIENTSLVPQALRGVLCKQFNCSWQLPNSLALEKYHEENAAICKLWVTVAAVYRPYDIVKRELAIFRSSLQVFASEHKNMLDVVPETSS